MKRTYQPSKTRRARRHGFLVRMRTRTGRAVIRNRRSIGMAPAGCLAPICGDVLARPGSAAIEASDGFRSAAQVVWKGYVRALAEDGERRNLSGYTFYFARRGEGPPRLGILISRRHARNATDRNRIKRCIREAFRAEQQRIGPLDVLVRPPLAVAPGARMIERLRELLGRLSTSSGR